MALKMTVVVLSRIAVAVAILALSAACATAEKGIGDSTRLTYPRIGPLPESDWTAEQRQVIPRYRLTNGKFPNILTTLANHPKLFEKFQDFNNYVALETSLPPRDRELLILRTGWLCRSDFELGWHVLRGRAAGLTDQELARIAQGSNADGWNALDATLLRAADELFYNTFIGDETWHALAKHYDQRQMMDILFTVGEYNMLAMFLNSAGIQLDEGVPHYPSAGSREK
jgi:alkylhydroperoxidase family enzyme